MSLFYRRSIQNMLTHCSYFLTKEQLSSFVTRLNLENEEAMSAQWELAILYSLNASGFIQHEPNLIKRPDVRWMSRSSNHEFIADVRTISDEGYEKENPREFYRHELGRQVRLISDLDSSFFRDEPDYIMEGLEYRDRKVKLLYPPVNECKRLFNKDFQLFVRKIKANKPAYDMIHLIGNDFSVKIIYQVQAGGMRIGGGNISYNIPYSAMRNPLFHALKKKAAQLRGANYKGIKGIILTDGGCHTLTNGLRDPTRRVYTDDDIILRFLKGSESISFVMTVFAKREQKLFSPLEPLKINAKLYSNSNALFPITNICQAALMNFANYIPLPKLDGYNAYNHLKNGWDNHNKGWYCGVKVTTQDFMRKISISSRSLAELLAQRITLEKFCEINKINSENANFLNVWLSQGFGISNVKYEREDDEDDDHIVLTYEPDFALKKYEVPKQGVRRFFYKMWEKSGFLPKRYMR